MNFIPKYVNAIFFDIFQSNSSTYHEHKVTEIAIAEIAEIAEVPARDSRSVEIAS